MTPVRFSRYPIALLVFVFALWATAVGAAGPVRGAAEGLVVQPADLPTTFALRGGDDQPDGRHVALYLRPEVLVAPAGGDLFGVMASLEVLDDARAAAARFSSTADAGSIRDAMGAASGAGETAVPLEARVTGADETVLFRVEHVLQGIEVVDYRYRLRVANAVADLMISGRVGADGAEPADLARQARQIAERQVARLLAARE